MRKPVGCWLAATLLRLQLQRKKKEKSPRQCRLSGAFYQLLPQNTATSKREARRWWMNAGALNVDRNVSFCASICSKEVANY